MSGEHDHPGIDRIRQRFERWRRQRGGPGKLIPQELWDEAADVARVVGVAATARALCVDRYRLASQMAECESAAGAAEIRDKAFVEIDASGLLSGTTVLRFESRDGERLQIEVSGASTVDVVRLAQAFWSRQR